MEEKKINVPEEINDDELDLVAGGAYTQEQWNAMSTEERKAAQQRSLAIMRGLVQGTCELL